MINDDLVSFPRQFKLLQYNNPAVMQNFQISRPADTGYGL